ncbi:hypothetical protein ACJJTC_006602 [Scirpophaga incertulas]
MEVTNKNFEEQLSNITDDIKRSSFIGFDAEFTAILAGENFKHRLFDNNEDRYQKMRKDVRHMIMTQIGLTVFQYDRDIDTYVANSYTFHLCPQSFGEIDQSFIFQASTLEFLCKHNFDFNKFIYEGLPFLNKFEEDKVRQQIKDGTLLQSLIQMLDLDNEKYLQINCSEVSKWLSTSEEETMYIDVKYPILRYILHNEIRNRFPNVMTTDSLGNSNKLLIYRNKNVDGATNASQELLEHNLMNSLLGFSRIISLLQRYKKPMVGHNLFLDTLLLHNQFIGPLPKKYSVFKKNIHEIFPTIFDTKFISLDMAKKLTFDEVWKSNTLQILYEFFAEGKCKKLEKAVNPIRLNTPFDVKQSYHEAGWDSFCSGYCFIRLGHWAACDTIGHAKPMGPTEIVAALDPFCNKINIIRGAVRYMNLIDNDPVSNRPSLLHVKSLNETTINISKVASALSNYGAIDIQAYGRQTALVATGAQLTVDRILKNYKNSKEYKISEFSAIKHSVAGRVALWSGAFITGGILLYFFHRNVKSKVTLV